MKNNLPIKKDNTILGKIKAFFKKLFFRNKAEQTAKIVQPTVKKENDKRTSFLNNIKAESGNDNVSNDVNIQREEFLEKFEKNPSLFYELSIERLEKIEKYYEDSIKDLEGKLVKIKSTI